MLQLEQLIAKKDEKLKSVATKLERTKKTICLLNNGTNSLDHLITFGKSFGDHRGVGFKDESSGTKTVFIKFGLLAYPIEASYHKPIIKSIATEGKSAIQQYIATCKSTKFSRQERKSKNFILICHFYDVKGHIRPRCFTLMNF